jgi:uncharacterized membrane protein YhiD involved in acid resistance
MRSATDVIPPPSLARVLAASGHLAFAVIGTVTVLAVHVLGRPLGRLIDPDNPAEAEEDLLPTSCTSPASRRASRASAP